MKLSDLVNKYGTGTTIREKILSSLPYIFNFEFPIFDESHRVELENKIVKHFLNYKCFTDDEDEFNLNLDEWLNERMPGFNKLYESCTFNIRPLINQSSETVMSGTSTGTAQGNSSTIRTESGTSKDETVTESTNSHGESTQNEALGTRTSTAQNSSNTLNRENDTPEGKITTLDDGYLSRVTDSTTKSNDNTQEASKNNNKQVSTGESIDKGKVTNNGQSSNNSTVTGNNENTTTNTNNSKQTTTGLSGISESELLIKYRDALINVDNMIITDIKELFVLTY